MPSLQQILNHLHIYGTYIHRINPNIYYNTLIVFIFCGMILTGKAKVDFYFIFYLSQGVRQDFGTCLLYKQQHYVKYIFTKNFRVALCKDIFWGMCIFNSIYYHDLSRAQHIVKLSRVYNKDALFASLCKAMINDK